MMLGIRLACLQLAAFLVVVCLAAPGQADNFRLLRLDGFLVKWGESRFGTGATITWGFAKHRRAFTDARNCRVLEPLDELARANGATPEALRAEFGTAFRLWAEAANLRFQYVGDPETADILIGAQGEPRDVAYANVWHLSGPGAALARISRATICLNPLAAWETSPDGNDDTYEIGRVAAHEIGHAIGLDHPGRTGALMGYKYEEQREALEPGDVTGVAVLYGLRPARNTSATGDNWPTRR